MNCELQSIQSFPTLLVFYKDSNDDFLDDNMDYWITESQ